MRKKDKVKKIKQVIGNSLYQVNDFTTYPDFKFDLLVEKKIRVIVGKLQSKIPICDPNVAKTVFADLRDNEICYVVEEKGKWIRTKSHVRALGSSKNRIKL